MADKYEVIRPWHGVAKGSIVELENVHPAFEAHVRKLPEAVAAVLVPAVASLDKEAIKQQLTAAGVEFDARKSAAELAKLLPVSE